MRHPITYSGIDKMKHKIFKTLLAVVAATMSFCAEADTETVNGIQWTYSVKDGEAILGGEDYARAILGSTSGAITIPSTLGGYPVTSVLIPDSVTNIGESAFFFCSSLTGVTIPNSVTNIGGGAFFACWSLTSVTIPDSVTSIGRNAFAFCTSLTSVTIPNSVTIIGKEAFEGCSSLTSITIPHSVTSIGVDAFGRCGELTIYTDKGNSDRLRKMLENTGANVKEIIEQKAKEQEAEEQESRGIRWELVLGRVGIIVVLSGLFFWIDRRKNKREGASDKTEQRTTSH